MKSPALLQVAVEVTTATEPLVGEVLANTFGAATVTFDDLESGRSYVSVYVAEKGFQRATRRAELRRKLGGIPAAEKAPIRIRRLKPQDWSESWKRHFKPIVIGRQLLIKPSWSRRKPAKGAKLIILDPGLSFGTGQHPTTLFCLQQLASTRQPGIRQAFLDMGTGTGILAIAAAKLGYSPVEAFDFDPDSVRIAGDNARRNRIRNIQLSQRDLTRIPLRSSIRYDVVCANLMYDLLIAERRRIINRLKSDGRLLLAGILNSQFDQVRVAYEEAGLFCIEKNSVNEWTSGVFGFDGGGNQR